MHRRLLPRDFQGNDHGVDLLLCGLGAFFFTELLKNLSAGTRWDPLLKLLFAGIISTGIAVTIFHSHPIKIVGFALAGAGVAALSHKLWRLLSAGADYLILNIGQRRR